MKKPDNENLNNDNNDVIKQLIGMGQHSARKSYYPMLQEKIVELNKEKVKYKTMFDCMADAILLVRDNGIIKDVNLEACSRYKYSRSEMIEMPISRLDPLHNDTEVIETIKKIKEENPLRFETVHATKDNINIDTEIIANMVEYENEQVILCVCRNISELKQTEIELASSQNQLQSIFTAAPCGIGVIRNQLLTYMNNYFCEMTGYSDDELLGQNSQILYLTDVEFRRVENDISRQISEQGVGTVETQFKCKDNRILDIKLSSSPLDMSDWSKGLTFTVIDITNEKATEKALEKRIIALTNPLENADVSFEELFNLEDIQNIQDLFSAATGVGSIITKPDGTYITSPSCFCSYCSELAYITKKGQSFCKQSSINLSKVNTKGPTIELHGKCGILGAGASITIGGKHIANWLIGHVRRNDRTDEQIKEFILELGGDPKIALEKYHQTPTMEENQFVIIANALFAFANQLSNTAYQNVQQASLINKSRRAEEVVKNYNKILRSEVEKRTAELENKNNLLHKEIEERNRTEKELQTTQTQLIQSEKMASIGQLASNIAHEINTPLGAIGSSNTIIKQFFNDIIELLEDYAKMFQSENKDLIKKVVKYSSIQNAPTLSTREIRQMRSDLTKLLEGQVSCSPTLLAGFLVNSGMSDIYKEFIPLFKSSDSERILDMLEKITAIYQGNVIIEQAIQQSSRIVFALKEYARAGDTKNKILASVRKSLETAITLYANKLKHGLELELELEDVPEIFCYPSELNQVWTNLIHNAVQAMEEQGKLEISMKKSGDNIEIRIKDNGCGIPDDNIDKIFEPLFTTKPSGMGSGLGLDIVKRIIDRHNGSIRAESSFGKGAIFIVTLPIILRQEIAINS